MSDDVTLPPVPLDSELTLGPVPPDPYSTMPPFGGQAASAEPINNRVPGHEILGELGRGGMGVVYKARQIALNRIVALKMILAGSHADEAGRDRFRAEAESIARLQHPNIVAVYEIGEHDAHPYFSLEFCAGGSLEKKLGGTPLQPQEAARLVCTLARAVQVAHDHNVVHRDLKPANVLLSFPHDREGEASVIPKITDFGLARRLDQDSNQTRTGAILGTPSYMAPEQAGGRTREIGPACDVWALGAILYECLTGRPPFRAATALDTVLEVVNDDPALPSRVNARVPRDLETISLKCLQKDPRRRYPSAAELADDLQRYLDGEPIRARPVWMIERTTKWIRRRPAIAGLLLLALLLTVAGVAGVFYEWREASLQRAEAEKQRDLARKASREASARAEAEAKALQEVTLARRQAEQGRSTAEQALRRARKGLYFYDVLRAERDLRAGLPDRATTLLNNCPLDLRGWEWHHLSQLCRTDSLQIAGHARDVWAVAWSPDGKMLASGSMDGSIRLWNPTSGQEIRRLEGTKNSWISFVTFSPDGKQLASGSMSFDVNVFNRTKDWEKSTSGDVLLWDVGTGKRLREFPGRISVQFSSDGKRLAFPAGRTAKIADAFSGKTLATTGTHNFPVFGVGFSADGKTITTSSYDATRISAAAWEDPAPIRVGGELKTWDATTGKPAGPTFAQPRYGLGNAARHRDGVRLVGLTLDGTIHVWDTTTGKMLHTFEPRAVRGAGLCITPDDRLLVSYLDGQSFYYDLNTGATVGTILGPDNQVALSPDGRWLATAAKANRPLRLYDLKRSTEPFERFNLPAMVASTAFSPDGSRLAVLSVEGRLRLLDTKTTKEIANVPSKGIRLAFTPDGKRLVTAGAGSGGWFGYAELAIRDAGTGKVRTLLKGHGDSIVGISISADSRWLASVACDVNNARRPGAVMIWDLQSGQLIHHIKQKKHAFSVALSPDGSFVVAACSDRVLRVWDRASGTFLFEMSGHESAVNSVTFHPSGKQLTSGSVDGKILIWEMPSGRLLRELRGHQASARLDGGVVTLSYTADGRRLASATYSPPANGEVKIWDPETGVETFSLPGKLAVHFRQDGTQVAAGAGGNGEPFQLRIWDATSNHEVFTRNGHTRSVRGTSVSRDGKRFATASDDGTVKVWDADTGEIVQSLGKLSTIVWHAEFSPDDKQLASCGDDHLIHVWNVESGEELLQLKGHSGRVREVRWLSADRLASVSEDTTLRIWDLKTRRSLHVLSLNVPIGCLAISPDGKRLFTGADSLQSWDTDSWKVTPLGEKHPSAIASIQFSPDGKRFAVARFQAPLQVYDAISGQPKLTIDVSHLQIYVIGWSRNGKYLALAGDDRLVRIYETEKGTLVDTYSGHAGWIDGLTTTASNLLVTGDSTGMVRIWRFPRGR